MSSVCWLGCSLWGGRSQSRNQSPSSGNPGGGWSPLNAAMAAGGQRTDGAGTIRVVDLIFDVIRIDFPLDGERHSRKVWNHVDGMRMDGQAMALLARNGVRIGVGNPGAWPAIRAIVEASDAEVRREPLVAQPGWPLSIELAPVGADESIFAYERSGRLVGRTFAAGKKVMNIEYAFHPELGRCTDLQVSFEVRHDRGVLTWERREGVLQQVPDYERYRFAEATAVLTLNPEEFLIIGLGEQADNEYLFGTRFLTMTRAGRRYETLYCLTPKPYQAETAKGRSS